MEEIPPWMQDHEKRDEDRFAAQDSRFDKQDEMLEEIREGMKGLATEKSIRDLVHEQKNILAIARWEANRAKVAIFLEKYGKKGYAVLLILAGIVGAIGVILGGWKVIIGFFFAPKL